MIDQTLVQTEIQGQPIGVENLCYSEEISSNFIVLSSVISFNKLIDEIFLHHSLQDFALLLKLLEPEIFSEK